MNILNFVIILNIFCILFTSEITYASNIKNMKNEIIINNVNNFKNNEDKNSVFIYNLDDEYNLNVKIDPNKLGSTILNNDILNSNIPEFKKIRTVKLQYGITEIGYNTFSNCTSLTSVEIPNSVINIGDNAFNNCTSLTSVEIPNSVINIGDNAFNNCTSLTSVEIPNSVINIGNNIFEGCNNVIVKYQPNSVAEYYISKRNFYYNNDNEYLSIKNTALIYKLDNNGTLDIKVNKKIKGSKNIPIEYFKNNLNIKTVEIHNGVNKIDSYAFCNCTSLIALRIYDSVTSIENNAFDNCISLMSVSMSSSITSIENNAFSNCISIMSIVISNSVNHMGNNVFENCKSLKTILIPDSVKNIGNNIFKGCNDVIVKCQPNSVAEYYAFKNKIQCMYFNDENFGYKPIQNTNLMYYLDDNIDKLIIKIVKDKNGDYIIPNNFSKLNLNFDIKKIKILEIHNGITEIGDMAFNGYVSLSSLSIDESIKSIKKNSFKGCSKHLVIWCQVNSFAENFAIKQNINCKYLNLEYYGYSPIKDTALVYKFDDNGKLIIDVNKFKKGSLSIPPNAFGSKYIDILFWKSTPYINCKKIKEVEIMHGVTEIGEMAFEKCTELSIMKIPNSVILIKNNAFNKCDKLIIFCKINSYTQIYAQNNKIKYELIN